MKKQLLFLTIACISSITQAYNNHGAQLISQELANLNFTLTNNQPVIDGNINRSINSIQRILQYDDVYEYIEELDQHFMTLEAAIEGGVFGDPSQKNQCKANLRFLRGIIKQSLTRTSSANFKERLIKLANGSLQGLTGTFFVGYALYCLEAIINKRDINLLVGLGTDHGYGHAEASMLFNPSKADGFQRTIATLPLLIYAGISAPLFYFAGKYLKRAIFFNDHLKEREKCIKQYVARQAELENNLQHALN